MKFQKLEFKELIENNLNKFSISDTHLCLDYINYLIEYNSVNTYEDLSFILEHRNTKIFCPLTLQENKGMKVLNFFGRPFSLGGDNIDDNCTEEAIKILKNIISEKGIYKIDLLINKGTLPNEYLSTLNKDSISKISHQKFIQLDTNINEIKAKFSKGHRYLVNREFESLKYKIIDHNNYKGEIYKMMELHLQVSGKITRSEKSWALNEKMILNKKGFLISANYAEKIISFSFFFHNNGLSEYFSSCTDRNYFKQFNNITHKSIFLAIQYLKNKNCKYLTLGETKNLYSEKVLSDKEKNIQVFKNSFGGECFTNVHFNKIHGDIINTYVYN